MNDMTPQSRPELPESVARRSILRGAMVAAPVIATLSSGAALARSSSLISSTAPYNARDAYGRTQCLDLRSGDLSGTVMDLGTPPSGSVTAITERDYRTEPRGSAATITEAEMCTRGGSFYHQSSGWQTTNVPRGILVSATALSSFAGSIRFTNV